MRSKTKKLIWAAPLLAVFAVAAALALFAAQPPDDAAAQDTTATGNEIPGMVQNLTVAPYMEKDGGIPQEQLAITWDPPIVGGAPAGYRIDLSLDGELWLPYMITANTRQMRMIYGDEDDPNNNEIVLPAESKRYFRVFATNRQGTGPGAEASGTTLPAEKPDVVKNVSAVAPTILLNIDLNGDGDTTDDNVQNVDETAFGIDLNNNGRLETDVDGLNETGITRSSRTVIQLNWTAPKNPPGAPVTSTRIEWSPEGKDPWYLLTDDGPATGPHFDAGLSSMTTRHYRVFARNSVGLSAVSANSDSATTDDSLVPLKPRGLEYILLSPNSPQTDLRWTPPFDPAGDPVDRYIIQARLANQDGEDDDDYMNLHSGAYIDADDVDDGYDFARLDLTRAGITFAAGDLVDIRIRPGNRKGYAGSGTADNTADDWWVLSNVPIGHPNMPNKQPAPTGVQDKAENSGRSGLNVTWPAATFVTGQAPADEATPSTHAADVDYVLVINGEEEAAAQSWRDDAPATGNGADPASGDRNHVGANTVDQATNDDGLAADTTRTYRVYAVRAHTDLGITDGDADFSVDGTTDGQDHVIRSYAANASSADTADALLPGKPTALVVAAGGHTEIDLSWTQPATTADCSAGANEATDNDVRLGATIVAGTEDDGSECGANAITGYQIEMSEDPNLAASSWKVVTPVRAEGVTATVDGLTPAKRYYFRVFTRNATGLSVEPSEYDSTITDPADVPTPPGGLVAQPLASDPQKQLKLCWYEQNDVDPLTGDAILTDALPVLGYKIAYVDYDAKGAAMDEMVLVENTHSTKTQFTDPTMLAPGTKRTYKVYSITLGGVGTQAAEATATTLHAPPADLAAAASYDSATKAHSITLTWTAGGTGVTEYQVERKSGTDAFAAVKPPHVGKAATYKDMTGLTAGAEYTYRVRTIVNTMPSDWAEIKATTMDKPDAPVATAMADDATSITVTWTAADNGSAITGYMVERGTMGADGTTMTWTAVDPAHTGTAMTYTDTGLTEMTMYYYRVSATNAVGTSDWSENASATTSDSNNAPMPATGANALPTTVDLVVGGDSRVITLTGSFTDADGDALTYSATSSSEAAATATVSDDMTMLTIAPKADGAATVTVTASDGTASATHDIAVTVAGRAIRPTIDSVSVLQNSISVVWNTASIQNAEAIKVALFELDAKGDVISLATGYAGNVHTISPANDPGAHTFTNVPSGSYKVGVANYANGEHKTIVSGVQTVQ